QCIDCHGTATKAATLRTSGPAAYTSNPNTSGPADPKFGRDLAAMRTPSGKPRFERRGDKIFQNSMVEPGLSWEVVQTKDTIDPKSAHYNAKSAVAKTVRFEGEKMVWGDVPPTAARDDARCAHANANMTCTACHSSWNPSCYGCHLPQKANMKMPALHNEGDVSRNYVSYNWQTLRDEVYMLARDGNATCNRVSPARSSCAIHVGSYNQNRESIYVQQQTISGEGFSGVSFSTNVPHTFSAAGTTKSCTDCHVSNKDDNNAVMAQLLMHGTGYLNFIGRYCWVGTNDDGPVAVQVTERDEPQAVIGSYLHRYAYPDYYREHLERGLRLPEAHGHDSLDANCIQLRGEYLYVAEGPRGMRVYDVASIANKGTSERIITAPFSPLGHDTHIPSQNATCVVLPTNQPINPPRNAGLNQPLDFSKDFSALMRGENEEQPMHPIYNYAYITDAVEGLIVTNVNTLQDQEPRNNFLTRALTWNEGGILNGARHLTIAGTRFFVSADAGVVELDMNDPLHPRVMAVIPLADPRGTMVQFRYLFVVDGAGFDVVDITHPERPVILPQAHLPLSDPHRVFVSRTYAYVANGRDGLAIIDVEKPDRPHLYMNYTAEGRLNDARDVVVAATNASLFAYVADGVNGLKVIQLLSPESQPNFYGFSPDPKPQLIAWYPTSSPALALSKGLERDRGVDETGHQIAVFGRIGSRPFTEAEMKEFYMGPNGNLYTVTDRIKKEDFVPGRPVAHK
ncbi:MAG TPA: hypothetical protein VGP42_14420, partial [Stellaceae bacterium]|nr:hypothetical protein [Stellaceae bacterium]